MEVPRIRVPLMLDHLVALMFCLLDCCRSCFAASTNLCLHLRRQEGSDVNTNRLRSRWLGFTTPNLLDVLGHSCGATQRAVFLARLEVFQQKWTADIAAKCTAFSVSACAVSMYPIVTADRHGMQWCEIVYIYASQRGHHWQIF